MYKIYIRHLINEALRQSHLTPELEAASQKYKIDLKNAAMLSQIALSHARTINKKKV